MIITIIALINVERENHKGHIHLPSCIHNYIKNYEDNVNHPYFTTPMVSPTNSHNLWILTTLAPEMKHSIHFNWRLSLIVCFVQILFSIHAIEILKQDICTSWWGCFGLQRNIPKHTYQQHESRLTIISNEPFPTIFLMYANMLAFFLLFSVIHI